MALKKIIIIILRLLCRPSGQATWPASPPVGCRLLYGLHTSSPFITTQLESWYSFYRPTEGGRLSQPESRTCRTELMRWVVSDLCIEIMIDTQDRKVIIRNVPGFNSSSGKSASGHFLQIWENRVPAKIRARFTGFELVYMQIQNLCFYFFCFWDDITV